MTCQDFEAVVIELAGSRPMDAALREDGLAHADTCAACANLLGEQRLLDSGLRALAAQGASGQAPERLETSLRSAFRAHSALPAPIGTGRRWYAWAAVAAACLILLLATANRLREPHPARQARPQPPTLVRQAEPKTALAEAQPPAPKPAPARQRRRPVAAAEPDEEFVPLFYGAALTPFDSGQVVRVKLPPSALVAFGLPVNANRADPVQADVLFAEDGLARAIRFVK